MSKPDPTVARYEPAEIGKEDAECPRCHFTGGRLLHLKTGDSLRCGYCGKQGPVVEFMRTALKKFQKRGLKLTLIFRRGKYSFEHLHDCDCNYCRLFKGQKLRSVSKGGNG
mgnify:CR=1 FL=1